jgi:hypothetical protein
VELRTRRGNAYCDFRQIGAEAGFGTRRHTLDTWVGDERSSVYGKDVFKGGAGYNQGHY